MSRRRVVRAAVSLGVAIGLISGVSATAQAASKPELTVMTSNLYLGSSLTPAIAAQTGIAFLGAVNEIFTTVVKTDFNVRANAIADEIAKTKPDIIGLQEVTKWSSGRISAGPAIPEYDFLELLQAALKARGMNYAVAGISENAVITAPLVNPAYACVYDEIPFCTVTLLDRDVILVNKKNKKLKFNAKKAKSALFKSQASLPLPNGDVESFDRGWVYLDMSYKGKKFRMVNTHLETEDFADVQVKQAKEFIKGPAKYNGTLIATGDFNSAATGDVTKSYSILTKPLTDVWNQKKGGDGFTCCQNADLSNDTSELATRIDLILTKGKAKAKSAQVVGNVPFQTTTPKWPSDHAAVVAKITLG